MANNKLGSSVTFTKGKKGGLQCYCDGYGYIYEKTSKNGNRQWRCKNRKCFMPTCSGRVTTNGTTVTKRSPHCHPGSETEVGIQLFLSSLKEDICAESCTDSVSTLIKKKLVTTPEHIQNELPHLRNIKAAVYRARMKAKAADLNRTGTDCNTTDLNRLAGGEPQVDNKRMKVGVTGSLQIPRSAPVEYTRRVEAKGRALGDMLGEITILLPQGDVNRNELFVLEDMTTSTGKRVVALASDQTVGVLNRKHSILFLDSTFNIRSAHFHQLWVIRGYVSDSPDACVVPLIYFLLEDKTTTSYTTALQIAKTKCPQLSVDRFTFMMNLGSAMDVGAASSVASPYETKESSEAEMDVRGKLKLGSPDPNSR